MRLKKDIKESREETRRIEEQVLTLCNRPVVTEERLHSIFDDLRRTKVDLEQKVDQAETRTQEVVYTLCGELQDLTKQFGTFEEQVIAGAVRQRTDAIQRPRSRSPQGSGPAEPTGYL